MAQNNPLSQSQSIPVGPLPGQQTPYAPGYTPQRELVQESGMATLSQGQSIPVAPRPGQQTKYAPGYTPQRELVQESGMAPVGPDPGIPEDPDYFSQGGTKPYISSSELWWYTFFGLNHFAVNEPLWGLAKLLTAGGIGLWWLWDLIFISSKGDFVQKNGFPTPFHVLGKRLFGQGAISAGDSKYQQKTSYGLWALSTFFAPLGIQALFEDKYPLFMRNIFMFFIIWVIGCIILPWIFVGGIESIGFGGWIVIIFLAPILIWNSAILLVSWWSTVKVAFNKEALLKGGIHMTPETEGFLNGFRKDVNYLFGVVNPTLADIINNGWSAGGRPSSYYRDLFEPKTADQIEASLPPPFDPAKPPPGTATIMFWALVSPIVGVWIELTKTVIYYLVPGAQVAYKAQDTALSAMNTANKGLEKAVNPVSSFNPMAALKGLNPADALKGLNPADALKGLNPADALKGLNPATKLPVVQGVTVYPEQPGASKYSSVAGAGGAGKNIGDAAIKRMTGGAREERLSAESLVLGGTVVAILGAGAFKLAVDYLIPN